MFKDNPNFIKIDEEIYIWENFLSKEEHKEFFDLALSISEEEWMRHINPNKFWTGKASQNKQEIYKICNKINKFLEPEYLVPPVAVLTRTPVGEGMYVHKDRNEENYEDGLNDVGISTFIDYGILVYFGDWEGGELYYPNRGIEFKPKPGSLIIHGAQEEYSHGVKPVTSGKRFFYSNFAFPAHKEYINPLTGLKTIGAIYV
jgi:hypothetical protein